MNEFELALHSILVVWLTFFGACIGSFLNVVVYRLPLGKSLSDPPSHCPKCKHPIRWFDNVPVFGWIFLGGKCRDCKEPISFRYPLVEFLCATIFGVIAWLLIRRIGDASMPEFFCLSIALSSLVVTLLAAGLMERDGAAVPWKLFVPAILMGPMVPYLAQEIFHLEFFKVPMSLPKPNDLVDLKTVFGVVGFCFLWSLPFCGLPKTGRAVAWILSATLVGLYLGFGGILILVPICFFLLLIHRTSLQDCFTTHLVLTGLVFGMIILVLAQPQ